MRVSNCSLAKNWEGIGAREVTGDVGAGCILASGIGGLLTVYDVTTGRETPYGGIARASIAGFDGGVNKPCGRCFGHHAPGSRQSMCADETALDSRTAPQAAPRVHAQ